MLVNGSLNIYNGYTRTYSRPFVIDLQYTYESDAQTIKDLKSEAIMIMIDYIQNTKSRRRKYYVDMQFEVPYKIIDGTLHTTNLHGWIQVDNNYRVTSNSLIWTLKLLYDHCKNAEENITIAQWAYKPI